MQNLSIDYVVGLVDGEGSFTIYVRNPDAEKTAVRRVLVEPKFYLKLIERDQAVLYALQDFFGCGSIYLQKDKRPNHQQCYRYEVFRWEELTTVIIPFFTEHQLKFESKRQDFELFCRMMALLHTGAHKTESGLRKLFDLKQRMH